MNDVIQPEHVIGFSLCAVRQWCGVVCGSCKPCCLDSYMLPIYASCTTSRFLFSFLRLNARSVWDFCIAASLVDIHVSTIEDEKRHLLPIRSA